MSGIKATLYSLPDGKKSELTIRNVSPEDMEWFKSSRIIVSMETLRSGEYVLYGRHPNQREDEEQLVVCPQDSSCEEQMNKLRKVLGG